MSPTPLGAFERSPLGAFYRSPLGARGRPVAKLIGGCRIFTSVSLSDVRVVNVGDCSLSTVPNLGDTGDRSFRSDIVWDSAEGDPFPSGATIDDIRRITVNGLTSEASVKVDQFTPDLVCTGGVSGPIYKFGTDNSPPSTRYERIFEFDDSDPQRVVLTLWHQFTTNLDFRVGLPDGESGVFATDPAANGLWSYAETTDLSTVDPPVDGQIINCSNSQTISGITEQIRLRFAVPSFDSIRLLSVTLDTASRSVLDARLAGVGAGLSCYWQPTGVSDRWFRLEYSGGILSVFQAWNPAIITNGQFFVDSQFPAIISYRA